MRRALTIFAAFVCSVLVLIKLQDKAPGARHSVSTLWNYAVTDGLAATLRY